MTNPRDDLMALAPCPFCGGEAERIDIPTVGSDPELGGDPNAGGSCISCKRCAASTALHFDRKENLYSSWNDRAASRPAPVDREAVARALCESGKFETGEGTCSLLCMDQLGSVRKKGCNHLTRVHGKLADAILSLLRPAEPVEAKQRDTWSAAKHDEIIKRLMEQIGMPNSRSLYQAFKQFANELHHMDLGASATAPQPTTPDAVVEPVAWRARRLEWIERIGVDGTFDASTSIGHYIATITDDGRGMWFVVGLTTSNYIDGDISAVQFAAQSDYENRIRSAIEVAPHPPASPDTSAAVLQSHALKQALDCLSEIAAAHIPDCPAHYAGDELSWAQRHVGSLRHKAEIARDGIAAAIRQLPTPERSDK